jgi:hypothetical protein
MEPEGRTTVTNLTVKGLPEDVYRALKEEAEQARRSLNQEVIHRLAASVRAPRIEPEVFLEELSRVHERLSTPPLTDAELRDSIREGRP